MMNRTALLGLALASTLAVPALAAPAMTGPQAEAAVKAAIAEAPKDAKELSGVPVEFAAVALFFPRAGNRVTNENSITLAEVVAELDANLAHWKSVSAALAAEKARGSAPADLTAAAARLARTAEIARLYAASRVLVDGARADAAFIRGDIHSDAALQKLVSRKVGMLRTLGGFGK